MATDRWRRRACRKLSPPCRPRVGSQLRASTLGTAATPGRTTHSTVTSQLRPSPRLPSTGASAHMCLLGCWVSVASCRRITGVDGAVRSPQPPAVPKRFRAVRDVSRTLRVGAHQCTRPRASYENGQRIGGHYGYREQTTRRPGITGSTTNAAEKRADTWGVSGCSVATIRGERASQQADGNGIGCGFFFRPGASAIAYAAPRVLRRGPCAGYVVSEADVTCLRSTASDTTTAYARESAVRTDACCSCVAKTAARQLGSTVTREISHFRYCGDGRLRRDDVITRFLAHIA